MGEVAAPGIKWTTVQRKLKDLIPYEHNPRKMSEKQRKDLKESIEKFNLVEIPAINTDNMLLADHQRTEQMIDIFGGDYEIDVRIPDRTLTPDEVQEYNIRSNKNTGDWDWDKLEDQFKVPDLKAWGFDEKEIKFAGNGSSEDKYVAPDEIETDIQLSDIIEIGRHRLLCGDARRKEDVEKILDGNCPNIMSTDPPYGVKYDADWRNHAKRPDGSKIGASAIKKVSNDHISKWDVAYLLSPANVIYIWHAGRYASSVADELIKCKYEIRNQLIWVKNNIVIGRGSYHWKHEPCWYAVKKGAKADWIGGRKQSTVWEIDKPHKSETGHSTQKPVECMARPIRNHKGDVYDPFIGSGTTMVACEQLERKCYAIDIDPRCCQMTIDRMLQLVPDIKVTINGKDFKPEEK